MKDRKRMSKLKIRVRAVVRRKSQLLAEEERTTLPRELDLMMTLSPSHRRSMEIARITSNRSRL